MADRPSPKREKVYPYVAPENTGAHMVEIVRILRRFEHYFLPDPDAKPEAEPEVKTKELTEPNVEPKRGRRAAAKE